MAMPPEDVELEPVGSETTVTVDELADPTDEGLAPSRSVMALRRRATHRLVAGVAGGLADHYETRPIWFRLPFGGSALIVGVLAAGVLSDPNHADAVGSALLSLLALLVVFAYLLLWWLIPREDLPESAARRLSRQYPSARRWPGIALLGFGTALLLDQLGVWRPNVVLAFALIGAGVLLYRRESVVVPEVREPVATPPAGTTPVATTPGVTTPGAITPGAIPRVPRERSPLGWIVFGVMLLVVGGAAMWASLTSATPRIATFPALGLLVLAAGLLVGSVFGRAKWLILPSLLIVPVMLATSSIRLPLEGRFGDTYLRPRDLGELVGAYRTSAGGIFIDLKRFQGRSELELPLQASSVFGDVSVLVPYDAHVEVRGYAGLGEVFLGRRSAGGLEASLARTLEPKHGDGATFILRLETGIGNVSVTRYQPTRNELRELRRELMRQER
jgi:phage shock protein PspC (stress-responsive transcriptional regulator)